MLIVCRRFAMVRISDNVVPAGKKANHLSSDNHTPKMIHRYRNHHHHHHHHHHHQVSSNDLKIKSPLFPVTLGTTYEISFLHKFIQLLCLKVESCSLLFKYFWQLYLDIKYFKNGFNLIIQVNEFTFFLMIRCTKHYKSCSNAFLCVCSL